MQDFLRSLGKGFQELFRYAYPGFLFLVLLKLAGIESFLFELKIPEKSVELWGFIIIALIFSLIIYNFHRYFLHEYVLIFLFACGIAPTGYRCKMDGKMPSQKYIICIFLTLLSVIFSIYLFVVFFESPFLIWKVLFASYLVASIIFHIHRIYRFMHKSDYLHYVRNFIINRMRKVSIVKDKETTQENPFSGYMFNRWATAHAIGITFWLPILIYWCAYKFTCRNGIIFNHQAIFWISIGIFLIAWAWQIITLSYISREFWR